MTIFDFPDIVFLVQSSAAPIANATEVLCFISFLVVFLSASIQRQYIAWKSQRQKCDNPQNQGIFIG